MTSMCKSDSIAQEQKGVICAKMYVFGQRKLRLNEANTATVHPKCIFHTLSPRLAPTKQSVCSGSARGIGRA